MGTQKTLVKGKIDQNLRSLGVFFLTHSQSNLLSLPLLYFCCFILLLEDRLCEGIFCCYILCIGFWNPQAPQGKRIIIYIYIYIVFLEKHFFFWGGGWCFKTTNNGVSQGGRQTMMFSATFPQELSSWVRLESGDVGKTFWILDMFLKIDAIWVFFFGNQKICCSTSQTHNMFWFWLIYCVCCSQVDLRTTKTEDVQFWDCLKHAVPYQPAEFRVMATCLYWCVKDWTHHKATCAVCTPIESALYID